MRRYFFGEAASTTWSRQQLQNQFQDYVHCHGDIRDVEAMDRLFAEYGTDVKLVVHCASQPSHDWAAREPMTDFSVNATGTMVLLEAVRKHCPDAVFIFTSTNKVYGDAPNRLPLEELPQRWEVPANHPCAKGIDENLTIDQSRH